MNFWVTVLAIVCLSPIWGAFVVEVWEGEIKPRRIPRDEILDVVEKLYLNYSDQAFEVACAYERSAWHECDSFEQGRWRRIREEIMRRERALGTTFRKVRHLP